jgi:hypothetical protein
VCDNAIVMQCPYAVCDNGMHELCYLCPRAVCDNGMHVLCYLCPCAVCDNGTCPIVSAEQLQCFDKAKSANMADLTSHCDGVDLDLLESGKVNLNYDIVCTEHWFNKFSRQSLAENM